MDTKQQTPQTITSTPEAGEVARQLEVNQASHNPDTEAPQADWDKFAELAKANKPKSEAEFEKPARDYVELGYKILSNIK